MVNASKSVVKPTVSASKSTITTPPPKSKQEDLGRKDWIENPKIGWLVALHHNIGKLQTRGDMEDTNLSNGDFFVEKVNVNLYMLHSLVMNEIHYHADSAHVVAVDDCHGTKRLMKLLQ
jgi:hypothetical protein